MYLVNMLQGRGYPVNSIFEEHVKPVDTMRFQEFLDAEKIEQEQQAMLDDSCTIYSFNDSDSYEIFN